MRVFRGGGLTKDAVYLRGLVQTLKYFSRWWWTGTAADRQDFGRAHPDDTRVAVATGIDRAAAATAVFVRSSRPSPGWSSCEVASRFWTYWI